MRLQRDEGQRNKVYDKDRAGDRDTETPREREEVLRRSAAIISQAKMGWQMGNNGLGGAGRTE